MARTQQTIFKLSAKDQTKAAFGNVKARLKGIGGAVTGLQGKLLGLAGIGGFGLLLKGLIDVNKSFQTMKSSLKTVTGSAEAANKAFDQIEQFATTTPFEIDEVVQSFIKLKALGLDPSEEALRSYGNTASAMGKSLDQMIEAVADAATGEMERLKEFGIRARKQGDEIAFTFQGVTTTVGNNAAEITGFLQSIGNNQFGSAMADQMKNLAPAFSNLSAALKGIQTDIGEAGVNDLIAELVNNTTEWINSLDEEQIKRFTTAALNGFADIADGADAVVSYVKANPEFAELGAIGFMLFGKKGLAAVLAGQALMEGVVKATENIGKTLVGVSGVNIEGELEQAITNLNATKQFGGDTTPYMRGLVAEQQKIVDDLKETVSGMSVLPKDIQLGRSQAARPALTFDEWAERLKDKGKEPDPQVTETNSLLKEIADSIRNQTNVAVAG